MFYIKNVELTNFRCYIKFKMDFSPNINIIIGRNAAGKTSLVESIYCLGFTKSYKTSNDKEVINKNNDYCIVKGEFENGESHDNVMLSISNEGKRIKKNNIQYKKFSEYLGYCNVIMFCPEDLELIKGSPALKRKFLDVNVGQISKKYLNSLISYKKILKQRNELLKNYHDGVKYNKDLLLIITEKLIEEAKIVIDERNNFINNLNPYILDKSAKISNQNEYIKIKYAPNCSKDDLYNEFIKKLNQDIVAKTTTIGPHRDDFVVYINDYNSAIYGSQGQQRTAALSIMLGLADLYKTKTNKLIIILDDVFSELDIQRQNEILNLLNLSNQIFITTTSINHISEELINASKVIEIRREGE